VDDFQIVLQFDLLGQGEAQIFVVIDDQDSRLASVHADVLPSRAEYLGAPTGRAQGASGSKRG
jgi:hypothetical protein